MPGLKQETHLVVKNVRRLVKFHSLSTESDVGQRELIQGLLPENTQEAFEGLVSSTTGMTCCRQETRSRCCACNAERCVLHVVCVCVCVCVRVCVCVDIRTAWRLRETRHAFTRCCEHHLNSLLPFPKRRYFVRKFIRPNIDARNPQQISNRRNVTRRRQRRFVSVPREIEPSELQRSQWQRHVADDAAFSYVKSRRQLSTS